MIDGRR